MNSYTKALKKSVLITLGTIFAVAPCISASSVEESRTDPNWISKITPKELTVNVKDLGAKGDGVTNDSQAFREAAALLESAGSGILVIPTGTYIVGEQTASDRKNPSDPFYRYRPIFTIKNVSGLIIEGNRATLKIASGLRYGAFDHEGLRIDPKLRFTDRSKIAEIGSIFDISNSQNIIIRNLELDGNNQGLALGGLWGDKGRQAIACGLRLYNNSYVLLENLQVHSHGLDGIIIGHRGLKEGDAPTPHLLKNITSEYNSRQGLSWVGGIGLTVINSKFNHTGQRAFGSAPQAGIDIEAENSICRDGYFENCEAINNAGAAMVSHSGDGGYTTFNKCIFWGTDNYSLWCLKPGLRFEDCKIYGTAVHTYGSSIPAEATTFIRCHFEDKPWSNGKVYRDRYLYITSQGGENVRWEDCTFEANETRSVWIDNYKERKHLIGCTFIHKDSSPNNGDFQCLIRGAVIENCIFKEDIQEGGSVYYINIENADVRGETLVEGPSVFFAARPPKGVIGHIMPKVWNPVEE